MKGSLSQHIADNAQQLADKCAYYVPIFLLRLLPATFCKVAQLWSHVIFLATIVCVLC